MVTYLKKDIFSIIACVWEQTWKGSNHLTTQQFTGRNQIISSW